MGTPDIAVPTLHALREAGHEVCLVITQPDRPRGRGRKCVPCAVKCAAEEAGLPITQPERVGEEECCALLRRLQPDAFVVVAFGQILPPEVLAIPRLGSINVHFSLLPKYRGAAPVERALMAGETKTGVTIMLMDEGMDTGPILAAREVEIGEEETAGELKERLAELGAPLLVETLEAFAAGKITPQPQDHEAATYARRIKKEEAEIDWARPAREIFNLVRAMNPAPGAYTWFRGKQLKIWRARVAQESAQAEGIPGTVTEASKCGILTKTGRGLLRLEEVQVESRGRVTGAEFVNGYRVARGEVLGR